MEMTSIEKWSPRPGVVIAITPSQSMRAALTNAATSPARPSLLQETHIRTAADRRAQGLDWSPWLAFSFHAPTRLDRNALQQAVTDFVTRHATLLTWFEETAASASDAPTSFVRKAIDGDQLELEVVELATTTSVEQTRDLIAERLSGHTSPLSWPSFAVGAVDNGADGFTVFYGTDHSHTDGVSLMLGVEELYELYAARAAGDVPAPGSHGSYVDFSEIERQRADKLNILSPAVRVWASALRTTRNKLPSTPLDLGVGPGKTAPSKRVDRTIVDGPTMQAFDKQCKQLGGGVSAGLFAILALIDTALTDRKSYLALNTVATRPDSSYARSQGWFINLVPIAVKVSPDSTWSQLLPATQKSITKSRAAIDMPARAIVDAVGKRGGVKVEATAVPPIVSYIDMRHFKGAEHPDLDDVHALGGPGNTGDISMWINRGTDRTYAMASFPDTPTAHASVTRYLSAIGTLVAAVAAGSTVDVAAARAAMS